VMSCSLKVSTVNDCATAAGGKLHFGNYVEEGAFVGLFRCVYVFECDCVQFTGT